ncbi:pyrroline-5-carboxylate reductase [compost metagenome]
MTQAIGVLGSGDVAQTLAAGFRRHGHDVMIGSRTPEKLAAFAQAHPGVTTGDFAQTAAFGRLLVLAVKGAVAEQVIQQLGPGPLVGKVIIDVTNPIADEAPQNGVLRYFTGANESLMERLQAAAPRARFVKAFNSVGAPFMVNPQFPGGRPTMFYCGNDASAKQEVARLLTQFGWEGEDAGMVESARPIEALCQLWCAPGFLRNEWSHAFHLRRMAPVGAGS